MINRKSIVNSPDDRLRQFNRMPIPTFGAALVLPIVLKLCSNKAQFISMLILVGINFIILKILTLCFFINSIYLYFYFQYLSTFNIRKLLLILKYSKDQIL